MCVCVGGGVGRMGGKGERRIKNESGRKRGRIRETERKRERE